MFRFFNLCIYTIQNPSICINYYKIFYFQSINFLKLWSQSLNSLITKYFYNGEGIIINHGFKQFNY